MGSKIKLTEWFPPSQPPWEPGVYVTSFESKSESGFTPYQYWDGEKWGVIGLSPKEVVRKDTWGYSAYQTLYWRGLSEKPE